jgi:hypothetical protein
LSSVERVASYKTPGEFDIKLTNKTTISPAKLNYAFEGKQQTHKHAEVSLSQIGELPDETKVYNIDTFFCTYCCDAGYKT